MHKYHRIARRSMLLSEVPWVKTKQSHQWAPKYQFRQLSKVILAGANRRLDSVVQIQDPEMLLHELDCLDIKMRWLLNSAMKVIFGSEGDPRPMYVKPEGTSAAGERPQMVSAQTATLEGMDAKAVNALYGGSRPYMKRVLAGSDGAAISMETLQTYWANQMTGSSLDEEHLEEFPEGEEYLTDLWAPACPAPERRRLSGKEILNAMRLGDGRKAPGYDGLTYFAYQQAHRALLMRYWTKLFNFLYDRGLMLPSWKIGLQIFIPKPDRDHSLAKSWRPITIYPAVFKVACRVISARAMEQMREAGQWSKAQKGGMTGTSGTTDATFLLRSCIEQHRRRKDSLCVMFLDVKNAFGSLELGLVSKIIGLTATDPGIKKWWVNSTRGCSIHIKSGRHLSKEIPMTRGVGQGNTNSALTFNTVKNTVNLWVRQECAGYKVYGIQIPDLSYVDDEVILSDNLQDLQKAADIHSRWSEWARLEYDPSKCALMVGLHDRHTHQRVLPRQGVVLCNKEVPKATDETFYRYLGILQNFGRISGSGPQQAGGSPRAMEDCISRITARIEAIEELESLHSVNRIEMLEQNAKLVAQYLIQSICVPRAFLQKIDKMIDSAVRRTLKIGSKQGPVAMLRAPTKLRGLRLKSLERVYDEALISNAYRWLRDSDKRLKTVLRGRVESSRRLCGIRKDNKGKIFFNYEICQLPAQAGDNGIPPVQVAHGDGYVRLRFETGRTFVPLLFQACQRYQVRISAKGNMRIYREGKWERVRAAKELKSHLRTLYLSQLTKELRNLLAWRQWVGVTPTSSKSYRWLRKDLIGSEIYNVNVQMLFNVLPYNSRRAVWNNSDPTCVLRGATRETVKHILCNCPCLELRNLRNSRHNKIVQELSLWLYLSGRRGRLAGLQFSTHLRDFFEVPASGTISMEEMPDLCFSFIKNDVREYHVWEITVTMDNSIGLAEIQKRNKYERALESLASSQGVKIEFKQIVMGVMGAIPKGFEDVLKSLARSAQTDWVIDEIHKCLLYYNHALWVKRDRLVRSRAGRLTG